MVLVQNPPFAHRHRSIPGINRVPVSHEEEGVFGAYCELAFYHTVKAEDVYESAARRARLAPQKILFMQLAYRKTELLNKLKTYRSDFALIHAAEKKRRDSLLNRFLSNGVDLSFATMTEAFGFAWDREHKTLEFYEDLYGKISHAATGELIRYLQTVQHEHIQYLKQAMAKTTPSFNQPITAAIF